MQGGTDIRTVAREIFLLSFTRLFAATGAQFPVFADSLALQFFRFRWWEPRTGETAVSREH